MIRGESGGRETTANGNEEIGGKDIRYGKKNWGKVGQSQRELLGAEMYSGAR